MAGKSRHQIRVQGKHSEQRDTIPCLPPSEPPHATVTRLETARRDAAEADALLQRVCARCLSWREPVPKG